MRGLESGSRQLLEGTVKVTKPPGLQPSPAQPRASSATLSISFSDLFSAGAESGEPERQSTHPPHKRRRFEKFYEFQFRF